jgi:hypothetical protein
VGLDKNPFLMYNAYKFTVPFSLFSFSSSPLYTLLHNPLQFSGHVYPVRTFILARVTNLTVDADKIGGIGMRAEM